MPKRKRRKVSDEERNKIYELKDSGLTCKQIAVQLDRHYTVIQGYINKRKNNDLVLKANADLQKAKENPLLVSITALIDKAVEQADIEEVLVKPKLRKAYVTVRRTLEIEV